MLICPPRIDSCSTSRLLVSDVHFAVKMILCPFLHAPSRALQAIEFVDARLHLLPLIATSQLSFDLSDLLVTVLDLAEP